MLPKRDLLFKKQISRTFIMHSVDGFFEELESKEHTVSIPLSLSMLGNILSILNKAKISLSSKLVLLILSVKSNKCDVSFIIFGRFHVKGAHMLPIIWIILDKHPVVNNLTAMSGFMSCIKSRILISKCIMIINMLFPFFQSFFFLKLFFTALFNFCCMFFCWIIVRFMK